MTSLLHKGDIKPREFIFVVALGSIGSAALSWIHVHPAVSVLFALFVMGSLAFLRWRIAQDRDFPRYGRFANALIETTLPSVIIYGLAHQMNPQSVFAVGTSSWTATPRSERGGVTARWIASIATTSTRNGSPRRLSSTT